MQIDIIKDILMLKEDEGYNILNLGIKKSEKITLVFNGDANFSDVYMDFLEDLNVLNLDLYSMFHKEILKELENLEDEEVLHLISISVIADSEGNTISIYSPCDLSVYKEGADELISSMKAVRDKLDKKLNEILDSYVEKEDDLRVFELVFKRDITGRFKYYDFSRMIDRKIYQQKQEIRELLSLNFEEKLINKAQEEGFNMEDIKNEEVIFKFHTDMNEIFDLQIGTYK